MKEENAECEQKQYILKFSNKEALVQVFYKSKAK